MIGKPTPLTAACVKCGIPFRPEKNGVIMHAMVNEGREYYYSIECDKWKCPGCGAEILVGFAQNPFCHNVDTKYQIPELKWNPETVEISL